MATVSDTMRQLYVELRLLENTIQLLRTRLGLVQTSILDMRKADQTLEALEKMKSGGLALVPIGANSYLRVKIAGVNKAIIGVGGDVYIEKDLEDTIKYVGDALSDLEKSQLSINQQLASATSRYQEGSENLLKLSRAGESAVRKAKKKR